VAYQIRWAKGAREQLTWLTAGERRLTEDGITAQLTHEPTSVTRNRKRLRPNPIAPWELRIRHLRVFYQVVPGDRVVWIVAVGHKRGNMVVIAGEEVRLEGD
jgi:mRNA-degrading endonuclease RelE of RelBE toxin-antitoxin system